MLQKIVNGIAIASGVVSITVIGIGGYVFIRKDAIIENVKGKIIEAVMPGGLGDLGGGGLGLPIPSTGVPDAAPSDPMSPVPFGF